MARLRGLFASLACAATTLAISGGLLLADEPPARTSAAPNIVFRNNGNANPRPHPAAAHGKSEALVTFPSTSPAPLRWKNSANAGGTTNIDFNVRPVEYVESVARAEEVEHATVVEREVRRTAFNLQLDSPKNGGERTPVRERTITTTRVRTVAGPGGQPRSVLSGRTPASGASPFADPFGDRNSAPPPPTAPEILGDPRSDADDTATLLQPDDGGAFQPESEPAQPELSQPETPPADDAPLGPPEPGADPDDRPPAPPSSLRQTPRADPELGADEESPSPLRDLSGEGDSGRSTLPRGPRRCGIYNDRDCCEDGTECLQSLDRVKTDTLRMFGRDRLDITPRYRPDADTPEEIEAAEARKEQQLALSGSRNWKTRTGRVLAQGQLVDLQEGKAIVETEGNRLVELKLGELDDDDLCFIAAWYNLPTECTLGDDSFNGRQFLASTFTWKASGLCHKPLYFEEVQLERYGHTVGQVGQPFVSGVHFFANIALLPYKMGINPPGECQYSLGYYRPGSCAPWMVPPVPLSLRGAATAAGFYTGGAALLP